jgi:hypothetical protein
MPLREVPKHSPLRGIQEGQKWLPIGMRTVRAKMFPQKMWKVSKTDDALWPWKERLERVQNLWILPLHSSALQTLWARLNLHSRQERLQQLRHGLWTLQAQVSQKKMQKLQAWIQTRSSAQH